MLKKLALQSSIMLSFCMFVVLILRYCHYNASIYFMGIGALVTIQNSRVASLKTGSERLIGCFSGGIMACITVFIYDYILSINLNADLLLPLIMLPMVYMLIMFNGKIHNTTGTLEACIVYVTILTLIPMHSNVFAYAIGRSFDTLIGFAIGFLTNWLIYKNFIK